MAIFLLTYLHLKLANSKDQRQGDAHYYNKYPRNGDS